VRMKRHILVVSLNDTPAGRVMFIHNVPSFNSGRNSVPRRGARNR
jgi:hypothetical protein